MNAAREKVRVAHALAELPLISEAFRNGQVSYSKVRAMTRIADESNEDYLMMIARHGTAHHVEKLVSQYRRCKRLQDIQNANEVHRNRELHFYHDEDGSMVIKARLPAEQGALVLKAIEMAMEAEEANVVCDLDVTAETSLSPEPENSHIEDGPHVTAETSRRIACDCTVIGVMDSENGEPLSIGRRSRTIPPAMRRALRFRDKGCRFPGCTNTRYIDGHHVKHWAHGGETSMDNLVQLCRHHHRLVHEGGFACMRTDDGQFVFKDQRSRLISSIAPLPDIDPRVDLYEWFEKEADIPTTDKDACVPDWHAGDTIDWNLAVGHLFPYPGQYH
jgi:hypothetical protein